MKHFSKLIALAALCLLPSLSQAQAEYYGYFTPSGFIDGNVQDDTLDDKKAFEILSFALIAENQADLVETLNSVGDATNVRFEKLTLLIEAEGDLFTGFLKSLAQGKRFDEFIIEGRRDGGGTANNVTFIKLYFKPVLISSVELEGTQGDRGVFRVVLDYGAIKVEGFKIDPATGVATLANEALWSRVNNDTEYAVD
ncbi:type VI secretion system tube protein Hcp [Cerasicoccus maritimus]|uniref:type VI secretion system tube protein Hcp n=1 Tax=Cerasicoccus maritimus TaxID=490089 RepID=UPI0028525CA5|nr:type VI secretion system tube protein Hcp [Cerasicoccus maritimus]